jgi:hypothetical protein
MFSMLVEDEKEDPAKKRRAEILARKERKSK